jgi:carotenoid cleavage dioxygenase-like enzyme
MPDAPPMTEEMRILMVAGAPSRIEIDVHALEVEGELPREIDGAFYRMAADRQYPSRFENDVPFNEDGCVSMFRFRGGRVDLRQRYVRNDRWKAERAAGRALFGRYRDPFSDDPSVRDVERTLSNTTPAHFNGVLLALKEDGPPFAMSPVTLETLGRWDFHRTFPGRTFTAHPKVDPRNGQMIAYGYGNDGLYSRDVRYYEISPEGKVTHDASFEVPYYNMMHDMGISQDYAMWPIVPICGAGEVRLRQGMPYYNWDSTLPIYIAVMPRGGKAADIRWFTAPTQFVSHIMNAYNEGTIIHFDVARAEGNCFPFFPEAGKSFEPQNAQPRLTRWTIDYARGGRTPETASQFQASTRLSDFIGEFPRMDDRYQSRPYRHGWMLSFVGTRNSLAHVDLETGRTSVFEAPLHTPLQEPCFIPRSPDAREGDGWIIQAATRTQEHITVLLLFDALRVERGPIATIKVPVRLRMAWHGSWLDGSSLDSAA